MVLVPLVPCRLTGGGCRGYTTGYSRVSGGGGTSDCGCGAGRETQEEPPVPVPPDEV